MAQATSCIVYLDRVADPGNLGAIARSAKAFGVDLIALSEGSVDPFAPKSLRASAGMLLRIPVIRPVTLDDVVHDATIFRTVPRGGVDLRGAPRPSRRVIVLGNEAHGVSEATSDRLSTWQASPVVDVSIAMASEAESLNVAAATAVVLYELGNVGHGTHARGDDPNDDREGDVVGSGSAE